MLTRHQVDFLTRFKPGHRGFRSKPAAVKKDGRGFFESRHIRVQRVYLLIRQEKDPRVSQCDRRVLTHRQVV